MMDSEQRARDDNATLGVMVYAMLGMLIIGAVYGLIMAFSHQ
jgi:hypothetical protein